MNCRALLMMVTLSFSSSISFAQRLGDGSYIFRAAGCADCHTANETEPLAGGYKIPTPFGIFYTPNISPDTETGIGAWSESQFRDALRKGISPAGSHYYPVFPYRSYTKMTDEDIQRIYQYLMSQPAVHKENRKHELGYLFGQRWLMIFWQDLFFKGQPSDARERIKIGVGPFSPDPEMSASWNRGAYLAEAVFHCTECHTPRNAFGSPESALWMSGTDDALQGRNIPNITPDPETGLAKWSTTDWIIFLASGFTPKFTTPAAEMASVVRNTSRLTVEDRAALVDYLKSLPPIRHQIQ